MSAGSRAGERPAGAGLGPGGFSTTDSGPVTGHPSSGFLPPTGLRRAPRKLFLTFPVLLSGTWGLSWLGACCHRAVWDQVAPGWKQGSPETSLWVPTYR